MMSFTSPVAPSEEDFVEVMENGRSVKVRPELAMKMERQLRLSQQLAAQQGALHIPDDGDRMPLAGDPSDPEDAIRVSSNVGTRFDMAADK
jgi:hypothetical protein